MYRETKKRLKEFLSKEYPEGLIECSRCQVPCIDGALVCWACGDHTLYTDDEADITVRPFQKQVMTAEDEMTVEEYTRQVQTMIEMSTTSRVEKERRLTANKAGCSDLMEVLCTSQGIDDEDLEETKDDNDKILENIRQLYRRFVQLYVRGHGTEHWANANGTKVWQISDHAWKQWVALGKWSGGTGSGECLDPELWATEIARLRTEPAMTIDDLPWHIIVTPDHLRIMLTEEPQMHDDGSMVDDGEVELQSQVAVYVGLKGQPKYGEPHNPHAETVWPRFKMIWETLQGYRERGNDESKVRQLAKDVVKLDPTPVSHIQICFIKALYRRWKNELDLSEVNRRS